MAFNNQLREYQMPGAFPETDRDEFGYTPGDYVQMMHEIDNTIVDEHDGNVPGHQFSASNDTLESRGHQGNPEFLQYMGYQQSVPPNQFVTFEDRYPAPPSRRSQQDRFGSQALPPFWNQDQSPHTMMFVPEPLQRDPEYGTAGLYPDHAGRGSSKRSAMRSNAPSPYAESVSYEAPHSQRQKFAHPQGQRLQAQPSQGYSALSAEGDDFDREDSLEEEENEGADEDQELNMNKMSNKSKTEPRAKEDGRKGLTRVNANGELEWLAKAASKGVPAVRHNDIRPQLIAIAEADRATLGVEYEHPDEPGPGRYNVTSFYRDHIHWGPDRDNRPEILFAWEEDRERNPKRKSTGDMYWEQAGKRYIVLDPHDNPVKDWDIPLTIASNIPGYKLEAMRRQNMSLGHKDFWARMPSRINFGTQKNPVFEDLGHPNATVNMPMERFRFHAGLCSWTARRKTLMIKAGLEKLYGNKLQNNSIRAFGRDLTPKEIKEAKKGESASFPIKGDTVPATPKEPNKCKSKGAASPIKTENHPKGGETQARKRKHFVEDEENVPSEEDPKAHIRPHKRTRREKVKDSIEAEVDDLAMFKQLPIIIDEDNSGRRYPTRSTRKASSVTATIDLIEEISDQSSADDFDSASQESSAETDEEEERTSPRYPFRRIPGAADVGGKCRGPSWVSSTSEESQSNEKRDYRKAVVPLNIDGRVHYATYEGLISNGPVPQFALTQHQDRDIVDASLQQNESDSPQARPFDLGNIVEEDTPIQAHRKRTREFLREDEPEAQAPPSKRLHTEQQVLSLSEQATHEAAGNSLPACVQPLIDGPQADQSGTPPPDPHAHISKTRDQQLDAEWAQVFEQTFLDLGFRSVNYSEVSPWNEVEVQSLIDALLPTREVYLAWTGEPAPRTDPQQSYRAQFDTIFGAFQDWWADHRSNEDLPILSGVMHWGRSVDDWIPPSKDSIYYEAFEKGHRAQYGVLPDGSGPRLEDASRVAY